MIFYKNKNPEILVLGFFHKLINLVFSDNLCVSVLKLRGQDITISGFLIVNQANFVLKISGH